MKRTVLYGVLILALVAHQSEAASTSKDLKSTSKEGAVPGAVFGGKADAKNDEKQRAIQAPDELLKAFIQADVGNIRKILSSNPSLVNAVDNNGMLVVMRAFKAKNQARTIAMLERFLTYGLDVNVRANDGKSLLSEAIQQGEPDVVRFLLAHKADFQCVSGMFHPLAPLAEALLVFDSSVRHHLWEDEAMYKNRAQIVLDLLKQGAETDIYIYGTLLLEYAQHTLESLKRLRESDVVKASIRMTENIIKRIEDTHRAAADTVKQVMIGLDAKQPEIDNIYKEFMSGAKTAEGRTLNEAKYILRTSVDLDPKGYDKALDNLWRALRIDDYRHLASVDEAKNNIIHLAVAYNSPLLESLLDRLMDDSDAIAMFERLIQAANSAGLTPHALAKARNNGTRHVIEAALKQYEASKDMLAEYARNPRAYDEHGDTMLSTAIRAQDKNWAAQLVTALLGNPKNHSQLEAILQQEVTPWALLPEDRNTVRELAQHYHFESEVTNRLLKVIQEQEATKKEREAAKAPAGAGVSSGVAPSKAKK